MFWHLGKAGGSTVKGLLSAALPAAAQRSMHIVKEVGIMDKSLWGRSWFRIGLTRDPCSYYKSLFFYGYTLRNGFLFYAIKRLGLEKVYDTTKNFSQWLRHVTAMDRNHSQNVRGCGTLSMRLWTAIMNASAGRHVNKQWKKRTPNWRSWVYRDPCPLGDCVHNTPRELLERCQDDLVERGEKLAKFDCWIRREHSFHDFDRCMELYRRRGGQTRDYKHEARNVNHKSTRCNQTVSPDDARLIGLVDKAYAEIFGYTGKCCVYQP